MTIINGSQYNKVFNVKMDSRLQCVSVEMMNSRIDVWKDILDPMVEINMQKPDIPVKKINTTETPVHPDL